MIKINKAGYLYVAVTILIGFSAVNTSNNLVYIVTSALLSYMLVSGIFGRKNLYGIEAVPEYPEELFACTNTPVVMKILNRRKHMPAFLINISYEGQTAFFPYIKAGESVSRHFDVRIEKRGLHRPGEVCISSVFPFNFFTRFRRLRAQSEVIAFPKPMKCHLGQLHDRRTKCRGERAANSAGHDEDIISIRDYVIGDPPKYISWKSTAKTGCLKTKELSSIELQNVIIDFDRMEKRDLEHTISCVTFTVLKLIRLQIPVGFSMGGETFKPSTSESHKIRILTKLALYAQN